MTDKEQIEEMAKVILQGTDKYCALVLGSKEDKPIINYEKFLSEELSNAGYKQEKEVAKEILTKYKRCFHKLIFEKIAKEYGVEID